MPTDDLLGRLKLEHYPRSLGYDPRWVVENQMGPNPLWLMEALTNGLTLNPGARVLDLGAGTALTSIFLAKEFGVSVIAADLWVSPTENQRRVREAGVEALVLPLRLDSHDLRFGDETFDAILSVDAYHYLGTDDLYLSSCVRLLRPGGRIGIVVPGLVTELEELPPHLRPYWDPACWSFHSPQWWRRHWERSGRVEVERADMVPEGWTEWLLWLEVCQEFGAETDESRDPNGPGRRWPEPRLQSGSCPKNLMSSPIGLAPAQCRRVLAPACARAPQRVRRSVLVPRWSSCLSQCSSSGGSSSRSGRSVS